MQILKLRKFYIFSLVSLFYFEYILGRTYVRLDTLLYFKYIRSSFIHIILINRKKWNSMPNLKKKETSRRLPDHQTGFNGGTISCNKGMSIHLKTFNSKIKFGSGALSDLLLDLGLLKISLGGDFSYF